MNIVAQGLRLGVDEATAGHPSNGPTIASFLLGARRLRSQSFPPQLFADPAWEMLLDLYVAEARGQAVQVSSLCVAAAVPRSTATRWISALTELGLVERSRVPHDARCVQIRLSSDAHRRMDVVMARLSDQSRQWRQCVEL